MPASIVVLPFVDMSPDQDQEYFCHGVTEEIITSLARVPSLRVISRTSAFAFQGRDLEVTEIGRRLRVGTALEGSVRKAGDRVRITTQLVNTEDGYQLWSKRFDRELADVFAIQDEIAATIVTELQIGLAMQAPPKPASPDVVAHDAFLRGIYALNKWTDDSMRKARSPTFARRSRAIPASLLPTLRSRRATSGCTSGLGVLSADDAIPEARWAVEKALELDPTLADAHRVRALIAMNHDWDRRASGGGARPRAPARSRFGRGASLERVATRASRAAARRGLHRAGRGRAAEPSRPSVEDADRLRPLFPSRRRSCDRAVREGAGVGAELRLRALCTGRCVHAKGAVRSGHSLSSIARLRWPGGR